MKSIMKTILRNTKLVMILAFLPALLSAAQAQAVDYKSTYKGVRYEQPAFIPPSSGMESNPCSIATER